MAKYSVMFDYVSPAIQVSDNDSAFSFADACAQLIEYATEGKYLIQQKRWEQILEDGEDAFLAA